MYTLVKTNMRVVPKAELLEAWLALTSVKYHDNLLILMLLNQWLAPTMPFDDLTLRRILFEVERVLQLQEDIHAYKRGGNVYIVLSEIEIKMTKCKRQVSL